GDLVEVGGVLGVVDEKKMMATTLHIPDNKKVEMPDSSVNLVVRPWCKTKDYWNVYFSVNHAAKEALDQAGIEIPFPQMDVHHYSLDKIKT
ncbi:MAG: mechanosensitive ion channel family protein, partial [Thermodesulfobacteriota bacterium]|nr:mechanosensitive ion channel family protein [Thermodesulfobacteriota bacterium]